MATGDEGPRAIVVKRSVWGMMKFVLRILFSPLALISSELGYLIDACIYSRVLSGKKSLKGEPYRIATSEIINLEFVNVLSMVSSALCGAAISLMVADAVSKTTPSDDPTAGILFGLSIAMLLAGLAYRRRWIRQVRRDAWEPTHEPETALALLDDYERQRRDGARSSIWPVMERSILEGTSVLAAAGRTSGKQILVFLFAMPAVWLVISFFKTANPSAFMVLAMVYLFANILSLVITMVWTSAKTRHDMARIAARKRYLQYRMAAASAESIESSGRETAEILQELAALKQLLMQSMERDAPSSRS